MKVIALVDKSNMTVQDTKKPSPKKGEILIKVAYSALDTAFREVAHRTMILGSLLHSLKVKPLVGGWHFSGTVENIAEDVSDLEVGDGVFGHLQYASSTRQGTLAEYITVSASECAKIPEGIKSEEAASFKV